MSIDPIFWLIAAVGFLVLEGMTFSMVSVWFAAGSAAALLSCLFHPPFKVQAVVFIVVSVLCLAAFKPLTQRLRQKPTPTNGARSLGRVDGLLHRIVEVSAVIALAEAIDVIAGGILEDGITGI